MQLYLAAAGCNVSVTTGGGEALLVDVEVVAGCDATELVLTGSSYADSGRQARMAYQRARRPVCSSRPRPLVLRSAWYRMHEVSATGRSLTFTPYGDGVRAGLKRSLP